MSEKADRPEFIRHYTEIMEARPYLGEVLTGYGHGEKSYEVASFGKKLGLTRIGIHLEVLAPGYRSSLPHCHEKDEEFVFVVEGTPEVWIDRNLYSLAPGDGVAFPGVLESLTPSSITVTPRRVC